MDIEELVKRSKENEGKKNHTFWIILFSGLLVSASMTFIATYLDWQNLNNFNVLYFIVPLAFLAGLSYYYPLKKIIAGIQASECTEGEVINSFLSKRTKKSKSDHTYDIHCVYQLQLTVSYETVEGVKTANVSVGQGWHDNITQHNKKMKRYSKGSKVKLFYNPGNNSKPMLNRFSFINLIGVVFTGALFYSFCALTGTVVGILIK